jgi:hypothetical protein
MTTQDHRTETTDSTGEVESATAGTDSPTAQTESPTAGTGSSTAGTDSSTGGSESSTEALFAEDELSRLRSRWDDVQAGFVDDPRECVQKADGLVSDVVDQLTAGFSEARSQLESQWARGEEASTEDLRLALKRYREFFERMLAI